MRIDRDKVTKLLKNYPSYRYAVGQYENHIPHPAAGTASYSDMPRIQGAISQRMADMGNTTFADILDYQEYKRIVTELEGALETLTDEEQSIIRLKWSNDLTLKQIAERKKYSVETIKRVHKRGLTKLALALRFTNAPEIITLELMPS